MGRRKARELAGNLLRPTTGDLSQLLLDREAGGLIGHQDVGGARPAVDRGAGRHVVPAFLLELLAVLLRRKRKLLRAAAVRVLSSQPISQKRSRHQLIISCIQIYDRILYITSSGGIAQVRTTPAGAFHSCVSSSQTVRISESPSSSSSRAVRSK